MKWSDYPNPQVDMLGQDLIPLAKFGEVSEVVRDLPLGTPFDITMSKPASAAREDDAARFLIVQNEIRTEAIRWKLLQGFSYKMSDDETLPSIPGVRMHVQAKPDVLQEILTGFYQELGPFKAFMRSSTAVNWIMSTVGVEKAMLAENGTVMGQYVVYDAGYVRGDDQVAYIDHGRIVLVFGEGPVGYVFDHHKNTWSTENDEPLPFIGRNVDGHVETRVCRAFSPLIQPRTIALEVVEEL